MAEVLTDEEFARLGAKIDAEHKRGDRLAALKAPSYLSKIRRLPGKKIFTDGGLATPNPSGLAPPAWRVWSAKQDRELLICANRGLSWIAIATKLPPPFKSASDFRARDEYLRDLTPDLAAVRSENEEQEDTDSNGDSDSSYDPELPYVYSTRGERKLSEAGHAATKIHHTISRDANWAESLLARSKHLRELTQNRAEGRADEKDEDGTDNDSDSDRSPAAELPYVYSIQGPGKVSEAGEAATE